MRPWSPTNSFWSNLGRFGIIKETLWLGVTISFILRPLNLTGHWPVEIDFWKHVESTEPFRTVLPFEIIWDGTFPAEETDAHAGIIMKDSTEFGINNDLLRQYLTNLNNVSPFFVNIPELNFLSGGHFVSRLRNSGTPDSLSGFFCCFGSPFNDRLYRKRSDLQSLDPTTTIPTI